MTKFHTLKSESVLMRHIRPSTMMSQWYHKNDNGVSGPYSIEELRFLKERGQLTSDDLLRLGETGAWQAAATMKKLFTSTSISAVTSRTNPNGRRIAQPVQPTSAGVAPTSTSAASAHSKQSTLSAAIPPANAPASHSPRNRRFKWATAGGVVLALLLLILALWLLDSAASQYGGGGTADSGAGQGRRGSASQTGGRAKEKSTAGRRTDQRTPVTSKSPIGQSPESTPTPPMNPGQTLASQRAPSNSDAASIAGSRFFGLKAGGARFVYIVDCSGSMSGERFRKACNELLRSIHNLAANQSFYVIFFSDASFPMFAPQSTSRDLLPASTANVKRVTTWITNFSVQGGTQPRDAFIRALALNPDAIFFLTDGRFDEDAVDVVRRKNQKKASINTVGIGDRRGENLLKRIAEENDGKYVFVR